MALTDTDERTLLMRLRKGDEQAFTALYHAHKRRLIAAALRLLKSETLAEEIVQEAFLKIWERRASIDPEQSFAAYLHRVAHHLVMDVFRKSASEKRLTDQLISRAVDHYTHVEETIFAQENRERLHRALDLLPPQRKRVYTLFKLEGKSYQEIGAELGIGKPTINEHITKANQFLRGHFNVDNALCWLAVAAVLLDA